jgi:putative CRISPR-associated protein (TIGR02619 family)
MRTILTTVGTSLLSNAARALSRKQEELTDEELVNYLRTTDPVQATAETNSLSRLLHEDDHIVFLHSDTPEGERCARLLSRHYGRNGYKAEMKRVPELNYQESRFKMRGLRSLVAALIEQIEEEREKGWEVIINATGGFKAEIAYATLVGLLFNLTITYIHERFNDLVEMPPMPIAWDYSLFADHEDFFAWITADLRKAKEVERMLRGRPTDLRMLLAEEDDYMFLSPAGEAFYRAFQQRMAEVVVTPTLLSQRAWGAYERMTEEERNQVKDYLRRLRLPEWRRRNSDQPANADCFVAPRGHIDLRLLYYEAEDGIRVLEILRHGEYERKLKQGISRSEYSDFKRLP